MGTSTSSATVSRWSPLSAMPKLIGNWTMGAMIYKPEDLQSLTAILNFDKSPVKRELTTDELAQLRGTGRLHDYPQEEAGVEFESGNLLVTRMYGEYHYSELTMESAFTQHIGFTPVGPVQPKFPPLP